MIVRERRKVSALSKTKKLLPYEYEKHRKEQSADDA